ncbi:MAG: hypothetical protein IH600_05975 [Bacteroidetes bacterium]|nr:hypothetical protein [Bacteroidota bacterium]
MQTRIAVVLFVFLLLRPADAPLNAQTFDIGAVSVYGNMQYPVPNTKWGSWAADTAARGSTVETAIPTERWEQMQDLGVSLAHFTIFAERLVEGPENVALKLNHAAWVRGMSLSLSDPVLWDLSRSERRPCQVESPRDFSARSGGTPVFSERLHRGALFADRHMVESKGPNAIAYRADADAGARVSGYRRGGEVFSDLRMRNPSGYYVLSARCAYAPAALSDGDRPIFSVELRTGKGVERFPCSLAQLRSSGSAQSKDLDTVVVEVFLGRIHLLGEIEDGGVAMRIERMNVPGPDPGYNERLRSNEALQMEFVYEGGLDITVDAVYLSDERAFALFNPGHPDLKAGEGDLDRRMRDRMRLLGADSAAPWPALRYLEFSESLAEDGSDLPARALAEILKEIAGTRRTPVRAFVWSSGAATKDSARILNNAASLRGLVSGRYFYPFEESYGVRPGDAAYYDSTYFPASWERGGTHSWVNYQSISDWYRRYAEARRALGIREWVPAMQTHSWLFRSGWPVVSLNDTGWLYEPNAAEFRFHCNLSLCYGATGMMFYQFSSWPGNAAKGNVVRRDDPEYGGMGAVGLLNPHDNMPRRMDTNGEDKWDSTRAFVHGALKPMGERLAKLAWQRGYNCHTLRPDERSPLIRTVHSWSFPERQGLVEDPPERCFVEIGEFADSEGTPFLFILNKRVDSAGQREIYLQLKDPIRRLELLPVTDAPVELSFFAPGNYSLVLPPGHAALLRVR